MKNTSKLKESNGAFQRFEKIVWSMILLIFGICLVGLFLNSCAPPKNANVSYTPLYKENKGLSHTFLLDKTGLIWVLNYKYHCLSMMPDMAVTFTREVPYKRFVTRKYNVNETRGYNCDGHFGVIIPLGSQLEALLRTEYIRSIDIATSGGGKVIVTTTRNSKKIFDEISKLDWKTPIPEIIPDIDTRGV
jgi:hypothetical protein